jgi:(p)ppGpp synthase/HD superfamily hydrolase
MSAIMNALRIANDVHKGELRCNGDPYIYHPFRVAALTVGWPHVDEEMVAAALLHDVIESASSRVDEYSYDQDLQKLKDRLKREVGEGVFLLVVELTNERHKQDMPRQQKVKKNFERLANVSQRAKVIKMFDRMDNLSDGKAHFILGHGVIGHQCNTADRQYAKEALELASVIGDADASVKHELENLAKSLINWMGGLD